jgi:hypothetical protein
MGIPHRLQERDLQVENPPALATGAAGIPGRFLPSAAGDTRDTGTVTARGCCVVVVHLVDGASPATRTVWQPVHGLSTTAGSLLDGRLAWVEHQFAMTDVAAPRLVHRTARIRLRLTCRQATRCWELLRSAGDVWAWLLDTNRQLCLRGEPAISNYQALCRQLTSVDPFGELSVTGARSVLRRYADAWHQAAKRRGQGEEAGFPRRKRALVPVRCYHGTFQMEGQRVRLPVARGRPELWVRLARPIPYPREQVRAVTLLADGGRLWLAVTAAVPVQQDPDLDPDRVAGVDLGIIHPYAVATEQAGLLVSGRALRAEHYLHLEDQRARQTRAARRAPKPGQRGSRRCDATGRRSVVPRSATAAASTRRSTRPPGR